MKKLSPRLLALTFGAALALAGCSSGTDQGAPPLETEQAIDITTPEQEAETPSSPTDDTAGATPQEDPKADDGAVSNLPLIAIDAVDVALAHTPGAVVEVELEHQEWEVGILTEDGTGIELHIDIHSGEVTREGPTNLSESQLQAPVITASEAIQIALTEIPGVLTEIEIESEHGVIVWEANVTADAGGEWDLDIDATTGEILQVERDH